MICLKALFGFWPFLKTEIAFANILIAGNFNIGP